jgi:uncharacterized protein YndB with AHSA1/START domain
MIRVQTTVNAPIAQVWAAWNTPEDIQNWNNASDDWHTPYAEVDLKVGGQFLSRMAAKDGSFSFDFIGIYSEVVHHQLIVYTMEDGRKAIIEFQASENTTNIIESFDAETENSEELQQAGWQAILDNFKKYVENK